MTPRPALAMLATPKRRRLAVAAIVGLVAVLLLESFLVVRPGKAPDEIPLTAWQRVLGQIGPDGDVSFETALDAFSLAVGPLPGVAMPAGPTEQIASGTGAIRWLQGYRSRLTDEQRAAVDRYLAPDPDAIRVEPATGSSGRVASAATGRIQVGQAVPFARTLQEEQFLRYLDDARGEIARLLRRKLPLPYTLTINKTQKTTDLAYTTPHFGSDDAGKPSSCEFYVNPSLLKGGDVHFRASMAHEMFHCFQAAKMSGADEWNSTLLSRPWLIEGSAEWVGESLAGPSSIGLEWWDLWLASPETRLFARGYDAVGFYLHMVQRGVDPWLHLDNMMYTTNEAAYREAADAGGPAFVDTWAPEHLRDKLLGDAWFAKGPWSTVAHANVTPMSVPRGQVRHLSIGDYRGIEYVVSTDAEILHVEPEGHVRMANDRGFDIVVTAPLLICVTPGKCVCPPGMKDTGPEFITAEPQFWVGLTGATGGAKLTMKGETFEDRCEPDTSGKPGTTGNATGHGLPRCGTKCPGSNGDPHLYTVDSVGYDFQAAGEFTLLRTPDGSVDIQARQEPEAGVGHGIVSNNTAVAVRLGAQRVVVYATPAGLELRVDGGIQAGTAPIDLGGGRVERHANGIEIDLPDGTVVWALTRHPYGIYILVDPSQKLVDDGVGLIGRSAPGFGIPRLPDGTALPKPLDRHDAYSLLYERFADAWRLIDTTTMFDYDPGKTTASYDAADYPSAPKVAAFEELDPVKVAAGRQACASVTDTRVRDQCAFDVAVTGDAGYVGPYVAIDRVAELGTAALDVPIVPAASSSPTDPTANPPVEVLPVLHALAGRAVAPDGTLYVSAIMADRTGRVLAIDPVTGTILKQVDSTGAGEVAFAAGSVWVGEFTAATTGGFQPCSVTRLDPQTLAVEATIPTACHRVWSRTSMAAIGDELWYVDPTAVDATGAGGLLRRIDVVTNTVSKSAVPVPFADGVLRSSTTAIFYGDPDKGQLRLRPGETALTRIGTAGTTAFPIGYPAGDGLWAVVDGQLALYTSSNGPAGTIDLSGLDGGTMVAADAESVYVERNVAAGGTELWRRYLNGRVPARIAVTPRTVLTGFGPVGLSYSDGGLFSTFVVGETSVTKLWLQISRTDPAESLLLVQGARLPTRGRS
jgi:hypothetical protein